MDGQLAIYGWTLRKIVLGQKNSDDMFELMNSSILPEGALDV